MARENGRAGRSARQRGTMRLPIVRRLGGTDRRWTRGDWLALSAVIISLAGLVIAYRQAVQGDQSLAEARRANDTAASARSGRPDLTLAALAASITGDLEGTEIGAGTGTKKRIEGLQGTRVDVTVRNAGDGPSLITHIEVEVIRATYLKCIPTGGPLVITVDYDIAFPERLPPTPFTVGKDVRYEVPPNSHERFNLSIGPREVPEGAAPLLTVTKIALIHDDGARLELDPLTLVNTGGNPNFYPDVERDTWFIQPASPEDTSCLARLGETVAQTTGTTGIRVSKEVASLDQALAKYRN